jgi:tRNA uridine 5-carbamoylmethylation protein Kti12
MGKVVNFPQKLDVMLQEIKTNRGLWEIAPGKFAILHKEVERLAYEFGVETEVDTKYVDLVKGCAVVKAVAKYQGKRFTTLGEVSPVNNDWKFPVSIAEKRAVDRAVLKALNIHGTYYSEEELENKKEKRNENSGVKLEHSELILERIKNISHQANLEQLQRENKDYLSELVKQNSVKAEEIMKAFKNKNQQLQGGK